MVAIPRRVERRFARVKVPEVMPRFLPLGRVATASSPSRTSSRRTSTRSSPQMEVEEHAAFRLCATPTSRSRRPADDLVVLERELRRRRFGEVVALPPASSMSAGMRHQSLAHLHAEDAYVVRRRRPARTGAHLVELAGLERPNLLHPEWPGVTRPRLRGEGDTPSDMYFGGDPRG